VYEVYAAGAESDMTACIIYNPAAGRGLARRLVERLRRRTRTAFDFRPTPGPGQADDVAERALAAGHATVIAAGGDGTVHEVANGLIRASRPDVVFGVWPIGSANDYAYALGVDRNWPLRDGCHNQLVARTVDVGRISGGGRTRYFVNGLGLGFNSAVTLESRGIPRLRGMALYGLAFVKAVWRQFRSPPLAITLDAREKFWPTLAFTVNLGKREGGFLVTPRAVLDDGWFDYVHAGPLSRWQALTMLPRIATGTLPEDHPLIAQGRCRNVQIRSQQPICVHIDGEFFCLPADGVSDVAIEILPSALRVLSTANPPAR
jgi:diacylglycerol kinase family enzyme